MPQGEGGGSDPSDAAGKMMAKVEAELEEVKAKIAALEAKIEFYEHATRNKRRLTSKPDRDDDEEDTLQNLERFLARPLDEQGRFLDGLQGMLKELQREKNLLLEKEAGLRGAASQSATFTSVPQASRVAGSGSDRATGAGEPGLDFTAECLSAARAFVAARGPEAPWYELADQLPPLPHVTHPIGLHVGGAKASHEDMLTEGEEDAGEGMLDTIVLAVFKGAKKVFPPEAKAIVKHNKSTPSSRGGGGAGGKLPSRPDSQLTFKVEGGTRNPDHFFEVALGESKEKSTGMDEASSELWLKRRPWSAAFFGDLPGFLGIAAAGRMFRAHYVARDGNCSLLIPPAGMDPISHLARLAIAAVAYAGTRAVDEEWAQIKTTVRIVPSPKLKGSDPAFADGLDPPPRVEKTVMPLARAETLKRFFDETVDVPGLERGVTVPYAPVLFWLTPVGCTRKPHRLEVRSAMRQLAETVHGMHEKGWAHRDLRWPNVVLNCCKEGRRWTVIDCEFASKLGTAFEDSNPPEGGWNKSLGLEDPIAPNDKKVTQFRDYWLLGKMIAELNRGELDTDLVEIGERLRAGSVPGVYRSDQRANDARQRAFMDLLKLNEEVGAEDERKAEGEPMGAPAGPIKWAHK